MNCIKRHGAFHDVPARFLATELPRLHPSTRDGGISCFEAGRVNP